MKNYKSLEAHNYFRSGRVETVFMCKPNVSEHTLLKAYVKPSQKLNEENYSPWVAATSSGQISAAHCNCMAGCESCVDLLFIKGSGTCPECGTSLRRNNFRLQLFEDAFVEKEVDIRKKIMKDFNKKEEDFATLREYNDYLEQLESIIFNLVNNIDVETTKKMVEQYKKENKDLIQKNRSKLSKDEEYLEMLIAEEERESKLRHELDVIEEKNEKNKKKKNKEALIDELMFSDLPASAIMAGHNISSLQQTAMETEKTAASTFSSGAKIGFSKGAGAMPLPTQVGEEFKYTRSEIPLLGPAAPSEEEVEQEGYLFNIRGASDADKGGGYDAKLACQRALMEAMCGLFLDPDDPT